MPDAQHPAFQPLRPIRGRSIPDVEIRDVAFQGGKNREHETRDGRGRGEHQIVCRRPAMGTMFEFLLQGADPEHLAAVGEAMLDEVTRLDQLLSRFDPTSEIARLNRRAALEPTPVDRELFEILLDCQSRCRQTDGYFDVTYASPPIGGVRGPQGFDQRVRLDAATRSVFFLTPGTLLDLGGYGKGYALDAASELLAEFAVEHALLHGGTSSVLARGSGPDPQGWPVGLRGGQVGELTLHPRADDANDSVKLPLRLINRSLSSSAVFHAGSAVESDLVEPHTQTPLATAAACSVIAPTATDAEVWSTGLLAMGRRRAETLAATWLDFDARTPQAVYWLQEQCGQITCRLLGRETRP
jgi:thiamine biosynthesis lipoprotein